MQLYFIGGASGSGKTAVIPYLKECFSEKLAVYDFDDIGVPENPDKKWRQAATEQWIKKIIDEGKNACLLGQIVLGEILSCPSAKQIDTVNFCLLDVSGFERIERLKRRNTFGGDQNMLNWAAWLRMHHQDPQWAIHVIQESSDECLDFSRLIQLNTYEDIANVYILDTSSLTLNDVAWRIAAWIDSSSECTVNNTLPADFRLEINNPNAYSIIDSKLFDFNNACVPSTQKPEIIDINYTIKY